MSAKESLFVCQRLTIQNYTTKRKGANCQRVSEMFKDGKQPATAVVALGFSSWVFFLLLEASGPKTNRFPVCQFVEDLALIILRLLCASIISRSGEEKRRTTESGSLRINEWEQNRIIRPSTNKNQSNKQDSTQLMINSRQLVFRCDFSRFCCQK